MAKNVNVEKWLTDDNLMLIECWTRDGYTKQDIAKRIGIDYTTLYKWYKQYPEFRQALSVGKELVDYRVENALLKSALGYRTKDVKVTTTLRYGKVVETIKETTERDVPPSVPAIQTWLYNRAKDKWKNMSSGSRSVLDEMTDDGRIEITVTRASKNESGTEPESEADAEIQNKQISVRKRTEEEQEEYMSRKRAKAKREAADTVVYEDEE